MPVVLFQMLVAPIAAHMIGRAGYRTGDVRPELSLVDDLAAGIDLASREAERTSRRQRS